VACGGISGAALSSMADNLSSALPLRLFLPLFSPRRGIWTQTERALSREVRRRREGAGVNGVADADVIDGMVAAAW